MVNFTGTCRMRKFFRIKRLGMSIQHSHVHPFFLQTAWSTCQVPCVHMQCGPKRVGRGGIASSHSKTSVAAWVRRGSHKGFIKELAWSP